MLYILPYCKLDFCSRCIEKRKCILVYKTDTFVFSQDFILAQVTSDLETVPATLGAVRQNSALIT